MVVGFHRGPGHRAPEDAKTSQPPVLVCIGAEDPLIPPEQRAAFEAEMRAGGVDWRMNLYGGVAHSFTNPAAGALGRPGSRATTPPPTPARGGRCSRCSTRGSSGRLSAPRYCAVRAQRGRAEARAEVLHFDAELVHCQERRIRELRVLVCLVPLGVARQTG